MAPSTSKTTQGYDKNQFLLSCNKLNQNKRNLTCDIGRLLRIFEGGPERGEEAQETAMPPRSLVPNED